MKLLLTTLSILICLVCKSQTIFTLGSPVQGQQARFGFILDSCLKVPIKDTAWPSVYTNVTPEACLVYRQSDKNLYYNDGVNWSHRILTSKDIITSVQVTAALGYSPMNPNGTTAQYFRGDGSLAAFPSIPSAQVNSDWNSSSGISQILNKPTIPTNTNQLTNGSGFITNISGFTTSDLAEGTRLYYTDARARNSLSGSSPITYNSSTGIFGIQTASGSQSGALSSSDWTSFNSKEANTASNVGSGAGLFKQKSGVDLQFKGILGTTNQVVVTSNANDITISLPTRVMSAVTRSTVTSTSATGYQISATRDYSVNYSVYAQITSALAGTNTADVFLEIAATNSMTPGDWTTISRSGISVAGIVSTSGNTQTVGGFVPAGYYVRIRVVATGANAGSAVFTYQVGQENTY